MMHLLRLVSGIVLLTGTAAGQTFQISEFMARNESSRRDSEADYSDWIEIQNTGTEPASLAGWYLTDDKGKPRKWAFPSVEIAGEGFLVVTADDDPAKGSLDASFSLNTSGEYLALVSPSGMTIDAIAPGYPPHLPDVSWGRIAGGATWDYLEPTPDKENGEALADIPPRIWKLTENPEMPAAGTSIPVSVRVATLREGSSITSVMLLYRINFSDEESIEMAPSDAPETDPGTFVATIPAGSFDPGDMIRWRVEASSSNGESAKEPPHRLSRGSPEYHGTVAIDPSIESSLPVIHWFVERPTRADTRSGTRASLFHLGRFYDNIFCRTRGQSTANWEKPKYKFDFHKGQHFYFSDDFPTVEEFNLNSFLRGQTREPAMFTYLNEAGAKAPHTFYLHLRQNGAYHGLFGYVEQIDKRFLRRHGFDATGPLYKAAQVPATMNRNPSASLYEKHLQEREPYTDIRSLANGINVRNQDRFDYFADHMNVPNYINVMAAMMVPFNHDQLTKNYYLYRDPHRSEWFRFPWDADQSFPTGRANTMENWTSPLYGDRRHTQELLNNRPNPVWQNHLHANILDNPVTREMYLRRVRTLMDRYLAKDAPKPEIVLISGEKGTTNAFYHVPTDDSQDDSWFTTDFDHSTWDHGPLGFGFETIGQEFDSVIATRIRPFETSTESTSIYIRVPFFVDAHETITHWSLRMKYDDGFVAYLNGVEVARANITGKPAWNSRAASHPDVQALEFEEFSLNDFADHLVEGENILAVQIANVSAPSSDLLVAPEIVSGNPEPSGYFERLFGRIETEIAEEAANDRQHWRSKGVSVPTLSSDIRSAIGRNGSLERRRQQLFDDYASGPDRLIPDPQPARVQLEFDRVDANPDGGSQDAEYLELVNRNPFAVDLSGWQLDGGIRFVFPPGAVLASNTHAESGHNRLYLSPNVRAFRQRPDFPLDGGSRFVIGNYSGHLSNFGETVRLTDADGNQIAFVETAPAPSAPQRFLRITEIMYHPKESWGAAEFIELTNFSKTVTLDLAGVGFTEGIDFTFASGVLAPGASIVLAQNAIAFDSEYGPEAAARAVGEFENGTRLSNSGERLKLEDATGSTIVEFAYKDKLPWPETADGLGPSLQLASPGDAEGGLSWQASSSDGGDPGVFSVGVFAGDADADIDRDGVSAIVEFAAGTDDQDPSDADEILAVSNRENGDLALAVQRSLSAFVNVSVECSEDMRMWKNGDSILTLEAREPDHNAGIEKLIYSVDPGEPARSAVYLRLVVSQ